MHHEVCSPRCLTLEVALRRSVSKRCVCVLKGVLKGVWGDWQIVLLIIWISAAKRALNCFPVQNSFVCQELIKSFLNEKKLLIFAALLRRTHAEEFEEPLLYEMLCPDSLIRSFKLIYSPITMEALLSRFDCFSDSQMRITGIISSIMTMIVSESKFYLPVALLLARTGESASGYAMVDMVRL